MKTYRKLRSDRLSTMMNAGELDIPPEELTSRLVEIAVHSHKRDYAAVYRKEEWLGKCILLVLVLFNLWMLYLLAPFSIHPILLIGMAALIIGCCALIRMHTRKLSGLTD